MPSKIRVFENPLVSLDTVGMLDNNHQDVSRSMSLMTNPTINLASTSTETFTSNKLSPKYIKYNKKDIMELSELSPMSPVEKRKMSKATDMMLEQDSMKSNMAMAGTNKRTSVVFNLMEEGNSDVRENEDFPPRPAHHFMRRISEFGACGPRPSIFSVFSQVASRSNRPSIFSRLSDFSVGSFSSNYSWNYRKIFLLVFISFSFFITVSFLLLVFWPTFEQKKDSVHTLHHIRQIKSPSLSFLDSPNYSFLKTIFLLLFISKLFLNQLLCLISITFQQNLYLI